MTMKLTAVTILLLVGACQAFSPLSTPSDIATKTPSALTRSRNNEAPSDRNRRQLFVGTAGAFAGMLLSVEHASAATSTSSSLLADMETSLEKLKPIPSLLEKNEWDVVRTILKTPPVNGLWNLGDAKNPLQLLARETDQVDLFDIKDELSISLQMCDQLTYDNVFVYFQPGNGKIKVKEPMDLAEKAMAQLSQAIELGKSAL